MKKNILICCLLFSVLLIGCVQPVESETKNVTVLITDSYYRGPIVTPIMVGKVVAAMTTPAIYEIEIKYENSTYTINGKNTYDLFKDRIGQTATGVLEIDRYDDGAVEYDINEIFLEE